MYNFGLFQLGIPVHEIGHALGLFHEHSRQDRDTYVSIVDTNIESTALTEYIVVNMSTSLGVDYDYGSIMHYGPKVRTFIFTHVQNHSN
jgi:hypothetical protein